MYDIQLSKAYVSTSGENDQATKMVETMVAKCIPAIVNACAENFLKQQEMGNYQYANGKFLQLLSPKTLLKLNWLKLWIVLVWLYLQVHQAPLLQHFNIPVELAKNMTATEGRIT